MRYCVRCLYPANHPLGLTFDAWGVCSGCRVHEERDRLDWGARRRTLERFLDGYRDRSGGGYDCIVPVSGARDSYFIVHTLKVELGLHPLLVGYNRHFNTERGIRNLAYLRTLFDCDFMQLVVAPQLVKRVTRETLHRLGSLYWHVLAGQTVWPVQCAVRLKVPLIVWGVHQGCDQVGMYSHTDEVEMTRKYRLEHDLLGCEAIDLVGGSEGLTEQDLRPYCYPHDAEIARVGVRGIYLSNYLRWDTLRQHEAMLARYDYEMASQPRTFDTYSDVDCQHYSGLHDWIKFAKWGYGKVTDQATREIRLRRMTRQEGIEWVRRYQDVPPPDKPAFLVWMGMEEAELHRAIDAHRDPRIWHRGSRGDWELLDSVVRHASDPGVQEAALGKVEECRFPVTPSKDPSKPETRYVLLERGYVDARPAGNRRMSGGADQAWA